MRFLAALVAFVVCYTGTSFLSALVIRVSSPITTIRFSGEFTLDPRRAGSHALNHRETVDLERCHRSASVSLLHAHNIDLPSLPPLAGFGKELSQISHMRCCF